MKNLNSEIQILKQFQNKHIDLVEIEVLGSIGPDNLPVHGISIGSNDPTHPTLGLFGGVHGLEKIGSQLLLSFIEVMDSRLDWDDDFKEQLKTTRIVCIPMINPWGLINFSRCNINGVDLMRNAPVDAEEKATFLVGGHRISNKLPWFRGKLDEPMEVESSILMDFVQKNMFQSKVSVALDFHSGFGLKDQIWYPYAKSKKPFPFLNQFLNLAKVFEDTYSHHVYKIEPQSLTYTTHGDLWDYAIELHSNSENSHNTFIPITLELGSWAWIKKNPIQIFSLFGLFNPIKKHRYNRIMRRHIYLIDFLFKAIRNDKSWNKMAHPEGFEPPTP